jgi:molybdenum-dependent DNA-binding transcriptional regulator ModE
VVRAKQFAWHLISEKPQLLEQITKTGSLHEVAIRLQTSYMKTVAPNHAMNENLRESLLRKVGGGNRRGTKLTELDKKHWPLVSK